MPWPLRVCHKRIVWSKEPVASSVLSPQQQEQPPVSLSQKRDLIQLFGDPPSHPTTPYPLHAAEKD
jgi:hypothetical protein